MKANPGMLVLFVPQILWAAYLYWCVKRGWVWVRSRRVERRKNPTEFKWMLRGYVAFAILLAGFTGCLVLGIVQ